MASRSALVVGSSGLVGSALVRHLFHTPEYWHVTTLVRRPQPIANPKLEQVVVDFDRLEEHAERFQVDDVFCCLGTTIRKAGSREAFRKVDYEYPLRVAELCREAGARQFLMITALGANPHSRIFYNQVKGEVEQAVRGVGLPALHIFRPSLLLGHRTELRPGEAAAALLSRPLRPLMLGPLRRYRPVEAEVVARAMVAVALRDEAGAHVHESEEIARLGAVSGRGPMARSGWI